MCAIIAQDLKNIQTENIIKNRCVTGKHEEQGNLQTKK